MKSISVTTLLVLFLLGLVSCKKDLQNPVATFESSDDNNRADNEFKAIFDLVSTESFNKLSAGKVAADSSYVPNCGLV
ncbi:MAG: hypothetical protein NZ108_07335, partial [Bacteroidia bacterium]|nr:hypothetical protein [Bacteroidia bacterium]